MQMIMTNALVANK